MLLGDSTAITGRSEEIREWGWALFQLKQQTEVKLKRRAPLADQLLAPRENRLFGKREIVHRVTRRLFAGVFVEVQHRGIALVELPAAAAVGGHAEHIHRPLFGHLARFLVQFRALLGAHHFNGLNFVRRALYVPVVASKRTRLGRSALASSTSGHACPDVVVVACGCRCPLGNVCEPRIPIGLGGAEGHKRLFVAEKLHAW